MSPEGFLLFIIDGHFAADLADAVTGCLADGVVVRHGLRGVKVTNRIGKVADDLLSFLSEDLPPGFNAVVADTFCNVVAIQAHSWHEYFTELVVDCLVLAVLGHEEERAGAKTRGVAHLRPIVGEALCNERHELLGKRIECRQVLRCLNSD